MSPELREFPGLTISRTSPSFNRSLTIARRRRPPPTLSRALDAQLRSSIKMEPFLHQLPDARDRLLRRFRLGDVRPPLLRTNGNRALIEIQRLQQRHGQGLGQQQPRRSQRQWKDIRHKFLEGGDEDEE
ncbi:unnamed protein product [Fusarium equiseti]|uniref:Uncharacterized protein n=1 Tax=Fusarium equiseti TaxID=61235 RepID=A0A8J2ILA4_FUSEQ|nr:unnamed protein product [Fusarium equiseti]